MVRFIRQLPLLALAALLALAPGCSGGGGGPAPSDVAALKRETEAIAADEAAHRAEVMAAASVGDAQVVESRHVDAMQGHFDAMRTILLRLSRCESGRTVGLDTTGVHDALQDVRSDWQFHASMVVVAKSLEAVAAEEDRHGLAMTRDIAGLRAARDAVLDAGRDYDCSP